MHVEEEELEQRAAHFWWQRERVEVEAASLFSALAPGIAAAGHAELAALSNEAHEDELRHADLCRSLVDALRGDHEIAMVSRELKGESQALLGPRHLSAEQRTLFAAVALGCVTETLSVALLIEIEKRAQHELVQQTAHEILRDEIRHSRLGWAYLEYASSLGSVSWLGVHIDEMIRAALNDEAPAESALGMEGSLEAYGVLGRGLAREVCQTAIAQIVVPGLARAGLQ